MKITHSQRLSPSSSSELKGLCFTKTFDNAYSLYRAFDLFVPWDVFLYSRVSVGFKKCREPWCKRAWPDVYAVRLGKQLGFVNSFYGDYVAYGFVGNFTVHDGVNAFQSSPALTLDENTLTLCGRWDALTRTLEEGDILEVSNIPDLCYALVVESDGSLSPKYFNCFRDLIEYKEENCNE